MILATYCLEKELMGVELSGTEMVRKQTFFSFSFLNEIAKMGFSKYEKEKKSA